MLLYSRLYGESIYTITDEHSHPNRWKNSSNEWNYIWNASYKNVYLGDSFCKADRILSEVSYHCNIAAIFDMNNTTFITVKHN